MFCWPTDSTLTLANRRKPHLLFSFDQQTVQQEQNQSRFISYLFYAVCRPHSTRRQFETVVPSEDSVITEMTSTLRDWGAMWKQLFVVNTVWANMTKIHPQPDAGFVNPGCTDAAGRNMLFVLKLLLLAGRNYYCIIFIRGHYISVVQQCVSL